MLKWVQALMGENPLPEDLRSSLSEQSVLRAIENQKKILDDLESKAWRWEKAGSLHNEGGGLVFVDPHWYQDDFDPFLDEPFWVMAEVEAPAGSIMVEVMTVAEKHGSASVGRVRMMFEKTELDRLVRTRAGMVDLECHNVLLVTSRQSVGDHWQTGGDLNQCLLEIEQRSRRQFSRDHQRAVDVLGRAGYTLKPLSHGFAREFERPFSQKDLDRTREILDEADIPGRVTCTVAQTFAEIEQALSKRPYAAIPETSWPWAFAIEAPSDGVVFTLTTNGQPVGYEIDFIAGLRDVFDRQKDLIYQGLGKLFRND